MARILGIDIGRSALRGVLLKSAFRRTELDRYVHVPLAETTDSAGRLAEVQDALDSLLRALGQTPDVVLSALDGEQASLRVIELPLAAAKRIADVLPFELESMLPFEVIDAVVDYQPINTQDGQLRLLAAAALRERVREHLAVFAGSPLEPRELAVGAAALDGLRALCPEVAVGHSAILQIGERETNFCALLQGRTAFARTLSVGIDALPDRELELLAGIRQTLSAYRAGGAEAPERLYLGGLGELEDLAAELAHQTGITVELLTLPRTEASQTPLPLEYTRAAALAGRVLSSGKRINLRSGEFAASRSRGDMSQTFGLMAMCGVAVLLALVFSLKARQSSLVDEQAALTKELADTTQRVFGKSESSASHVQEMLKSPQSDNPLPRFDAYDALAAISDSVPLEITHEVRHLRIDLAEDKKEGQLELQGALASIEQRDTIVEKLETHGCFRDIQRGRTSPGRTTDQVNYQIEAKLLCPGDGVQKKKHKNKSSDNE
jgi:general secretion pathway protein L